MTFRDLVFEVIDLGFGPREVKPSQVKHWINAREGEVWQFADWPVKDSVQLNLTVVGGTATVALPSGMTWATQGVVVRDNYGSELAYLRPRDFFDVYSAAASAPPSNDAPVAWTLTTDPTATGALVFRLGPTPSASATFTVHGWNLPIKRSAASTWTLGTMSADTDLPWWPDDYHHFLVDGVVARAKRLAGVETWQADEQIFQSGLVRLRNELMPLERSEFEQWGAYWSPC